MRILQEGVTVVRRLFCLILSIALLFMSIHCFSENNDGTGFDSWVSESRVSPALVLSNMGSGEWKILDAEEAEGILLIQQNSFILYESKEYTERIFSFDFIGQTPGSAYIHLGYDRDGDLFLCLGIELFVDDDLNVVIEVMEALSAAYEDYF